MNLPGGTMPEHSMSREEADELVRGLTAARIEVVRVDELRPSVFAAYCHCPMPDHCYWIANAKRAFGAHCAAPLRPKHLTHRPM